MWPPSKYRSKKIPPKTANATGCASTATANRIAGVRPTTVLPTGTLSLVFRTSRRDISEEDENEVLREGDIVSAGVTPISHSMYEYLEALTSGNSNGPHMFEGDLCLGYFIAGSTSKASVVYDPENIPYDN